MFGGAHSECFKRINFVVIKFLIKKILKMVNKKKKKKKTRKT